MIAAIAAMLETKAEGKLQNAVGGLQNAIRGLERSVSPEKPDAAYLLGSALRTATGNGATCRPRQSDLASQRAKGAKLL